MKFQISVLVCSTVLLSGCRVYSNYERPERIQTEGLYRDAVTGETLAATDTTSLGNMPWQQVFVEPQLQSLISKALENNADLRTADLAIEQVKAGLRVSRLAYLPSLALGPNGAISSYDGGKATKTYSLPVQASWQIGALGSLRNAKKQAEMTLLQTKAARQAAQTSIIAAVANLYYTLQMLDEQLRTSEETCVLWDKNVIAMEAMWKVGGLTNSAAVAQAKANLLQLRGNVATIKESIASAENALCVLLHEPPHAIERGAFRGSSLPTTLSVGVPLQLLSGRPDVRQAEYNLAAAFYATNEARANFYPSLTISGSAGWTNSAGGYVVNPAKVLASAMASLTMPLFANGQLTANLKIKKANQEAACLAFEKQLLTAGQEVSDALSAYQTANEREELAQQQVEQLQVAVESTNALFTHGNSTSYIETLTAQQTLLSAQLSLISNRFDKVQAVVSLYQALGGGRE
ncbi:MAG: TolC family protein [Alloprevotella sp.]|nr:TolC family protein [Alloprevotella sp.]MDY5087802.1 TolC family protein [Alloprevotella sp.]MDY6032373.1 TolC family protein [Alloprevotella sp.]